MYFMTLYRISATYNAKSNTNYRPIKVYLCDHFPWHWSQSNVSRQILEVYEFKCNFIWKLKHFYIFRYFLGLTFYSIAILLYILTQQPNVMFIHQGVVALCCAEPAVEKPSKRKKNYDENKSRLTYTRSYLHLQMSSYLHSDPVSRNSATYIQK